MRPVKEVGQKASSSVKSGVKHTSNERFGGMPGKKGVGEIEKVNTPSKAPGSVRA